MSSATLPAAVPARVFISGLLATLLLAATTVPAVHAHEKHTHPVEPAAAETAAVQREGQAPAVAASPTAGEAAETSAGTSGAARLGRLHPLAVHFPVALLLLALVLELARRIAGGQPGYDTAVGLVLALGAVGAVAAALLGLAAGSGEETTSLLIRHRALGLETATASVLAWVLRGAWRNTGRPWHRRAYLAALLLAAALVGVTGFFGAELTHGAGHLFG